VGQRRVIIADRQDDNPKELTRPKGFAFWNPTPTTDAAGTPPGAPFVEFILSLLAVSLPALSLPKGLP